MTAHAVEIGRITSKLGKAENNDDHEYPIAMIVEFDSAENLHKSLRSGVVNIEPWYSDDAASEEQRG